MRFSTAKPILRSFVSDDAGLQLRIERATVEVRRLLRQDGEVSVWHWIQLRYAPKSTSTYIDTGFWLHSPRLSTHPIDAEFLDMAADMSVRMREEVVALRRKLDGHVPYLTPSLLSPDDPLLNHRGSIDGWSEESFILYLLHVFALAEQVGAMPAPATTAEELLAWSLRGATQGLGAMGPR